MNHTK